MPESDKKRGAPDFLVIVFLVVSAILVWLELRPPVISADETVNRLLISVITRALGAAIFTVLAVRLGFCIWKPRGSARALAAVLPAFAVVINNFPIIGLATGAAYVTAPAWEVALFALSCLLIGLFEEMAFRGVFYLLILSTRRDSTKKIFFVTLASSAVFGAVHLFNLFAGAGVGATILQVGYSFLIGGMCSIALLVTGSIWAPILLHALYDFGGYLIPTLGEGIVWDAATVAVTAVLGTAVAVWMTVLLLHVTPQTAGRLFPPGTGEEAENK